MLLAVVPPICSTVKGGARTVSVGPSATACETEPPQGCNWPSPWALHPPTASQHRRPKPHRLHFVKLSKSLSASWYLSLVLCETCCSVSFPIFCRSVRLSSFVFICLIFGGILSTGSISRVQPACNPGPQRIEVQSDAQSSNFSQDPVDLP